LTKKEKYSATKTLPGSARGELLPPPSGSSEPNAPTNALAATLKRSLTDLVEQDDHGRPLLTFALPDRATLDDVSNILARLLAGIQSAQP
jgi:hypothetical protein